MDEFKKLEMKVGLVKSCVKIPKSRNLYKLIVDCGEKKPRQILTGMAPYYSSDELENQKLVILTNLKPRNIMGFESNGMILAADVNNEPFLLKVDQKKGKEVPPGSIIK